MVHLIMLTALGLTLLGVVIPEKTSWRIPSGVFGLLLVLMIVMILLF